MSSKGFENADSYESLFVPSVGIKLKEGQKSLNALENVGVDVYDYKQME